ncbi:MAG: hypothetical protein AAF641_08370 [Pseudomonadota bacterium]
MLDHENAKKRDKRSSLDRVADHARRVSQMCDLLESMADDLPHRPVPVWREATRLCNQIIPGHYHEVLNVLVPVLQRRTKGDLDCENLLRRVRADFDEEACRLSELNELLVEAIDPDGNARSGTIGPETLGYALRCFFTALRRNGSWEMDVLLPLASRRLNADDLDEMAHMLPQAAPNRVN